MKNLLLALLFVQVVVSANLKGQNFLIPGVTQYNLFIKFKAEAQVDVKDGKVQAFSRNRALQMPNLDELIPQSTFSQLIPLTSQEKRAIRSRTRSTSSKGAFDRIAFSGLVSLDGASKMSPLELMALASTLETYDIVEYVQVSPLTPPLPPGVQKRATVAAPPLATPPPASPDYTAHQFYLYGVDKNNAQVSGIYADYAWNLGITGQGVSIADIEWGWDHQHEDFIGQNNIDALTTTDHAADYHGTAVMGEMYAANNGIGVTGAVYGADAFYAVSERPKGRVGGILQALDSLEAGDIFVYEMQALGYDTDGNGESYVPADWEQAVWDVTQAATNAGIIVVAAAGNGNENLDHAYYDQYRARGDNGSIIVGAGTKVGRNQASFSTFGSRVNLCGIGDWSITTTGPGNNTADPQHNSYTHNFSGTSSSTPIVASAAVAVQSYAKAQLGITLTPTQMRTLLIETGTPQGNGGHIGPLPNIKAAIQKLDADYGGAVHYALTVTNGSGSGSYQEGASVSVSAKDSAGYRFKNWAGDISYLTTSTAQTTTLTMPAQTIAIHAEYTKLSTITHTLSITHGSGSGTYVEGDTVTITAKDSLGYTFERWIGDTTILSTTGSPTVLVTMGTADIALTATYTLFPLTKLDQSHIEVISVSSQFDETNYSMKQILDGDNNTYWHTALNTIQFPQEIVFKIDTARSISGFDYLPRQDVAGARIRAYRIEVSADGTNWSVLAEDSLSNVANRSYVELEQYSSGVQYIKMVALSNYRESVSASMADFNLYYDDVVTPLMPTAPVSITHPKVQIIHGNLSLTGFGTGITKVELFSVNGRKIMSTSLNLTSQSAQLKLPQLSQGVILVRISNSKLQLTQKILQ